ncbi:unnamed protein product, partial [marine sediment metagenome]
MVAERSEYKGNAMLELKWDENDNYPFRFGIRKAQLILQKKIYYHITYLNHLNLK